MTIVTPDTEPLELTRAWIGEVDGRPEPFAEIDGRICYIQTKQTLLDAGIASCVPIDSGGQDWPHAVEVLQAGQQSAQTFWDATTDARVVGAVKRWAALEASESADIQIGTSLL